MALSAANRTRLIGVLGEAFTTIIDAREAQALVNERKARLFAIIDKLLTIPAIRTNMTPAERQEAVTAALRGLGFDATVSPGMADDIQALTSDFVAAWDARKAL